MMRNAATLVLLAGLAAVAQAAPERFDVRVTEEVNTGSYSDPTGLPVQQTTLRLRYRTERWNLQADVPWLRVLGADNAPLAPGARSDQGRGDLRVRLSVPLREATPDTTGLGLVLRARAGHGATVGGIAPAESGQSMLLRLERPIGNWRAFGFVGLRRAGDLPGSDPDRRAWIGEIGASRMLTSRIEAGATLDLRARMAVSRALPEATLYAGVNDGDWRWDVFASRLFNRSYSGFSTGIALRGRF
jgi:hypothetical protein